MVVFRLETSVGWHGRRFSGALSWSDRASQRPLLQVGAGQTSQGKSPVTALLAWLSAIFGMLVLGGWGLDSTGLVARSTIQGLSSLVRSSTVRPYPMLASQASRICTMLADFGSPVVQHRLLARLQSFSSIGRMYGVSTHQIYQGREI